MGELFCLSKIWLRYNELMRDVPLILPEWNESCVVGHAEMDREHQELFSLATDLARNVKDDGEEMLKSLCRHTIEHFKKEEELLRGAAFPDYKEHVEEHEILLKDISNLVENYCRVPIPDRLGETVETICFWVRNHILNYDIAYGEYVSD